jgi:hypothetical protein
MPRDERTGLFVGRHVGRNPAVPPPAHKEIPVEEKLVQPHHLAASRPKMQKPREELMVPHFNHLYGTLRTNEGWRYVVDNYAFGTVTTVAGAQSTVTVNFAYEPHWRLSQWPGGTNLYYCIRSFSVAPQTAAPTTVGVLDVYYQDPLTGYIVPLGDYLTNSPANSSLTILIPDPVSDPDKQAGIGQLQFNLTAAATTGVFNWQMGFSGAYLLPEMEGFELKLRGGERHEPHLYQMPY